MQRLCLIFLAIIFHANSQAGERYEFYNGVRALGMGGAEVAVVNDETALLSNPAALGKLRNFFVTVMDPELDVGADTQGIVGSDVSAFMNPQKTLSKTILKPGKRLHERGQLFPSFVVTNFGLGVYAKYATDAWTDNPVTTYHYDFRRDLAVVFGFNFRMLDGRIKFGVNARAVDRVEAHRTDIPLATTGMTFETVINTKTVVNEGFGVGSDAGLILTLPWKLLPTLAVTYRDIGTTSYNMNGGMSYVTTARPNRTPATLDGAIAFFPILGKNTRFTFTAEMKDILDTVEPETLEASDEVTRRLHGGIEFNFSDVFFLRGGVNQGYWTAGLEISMFNSQLQLASYGEEVSDVVPFGSVATYTKLEDRRYVAKYAYRF